MTIACGNCGPYTESEGYRYVCTCTSKLLRVPLLEPVSIGQWRLAWGRRFTLTCGPPSVLHDVHKLVLVSGPECFRSCTTS